MGQRVSLRETLIGGGASRVMIEGPGRRVTVFLGEEDRFGHLPLHEAIVRRLRERGCAGATVVRGVMGYGAGSRIHRASLLDISQNLPVMVVFVDTAEAIDAVLPQIEDMVSGGIVVVEDVTIAKYSPDPPAASA